MKIRSFQPVDRDSVIALWEVCELTRPWNEPDQDIARKRALQPELFLVGFDGSVLVATVMAGYEGHRGWINYLAVAPSHRRKGYGRRIMRAAEEALAVAGAPKINLQVRSGNDASVAFYRSLGYEIEERVSLGKRLTS